MLLAGLRNNGGAWRPIYRQEEGGEEMLHARIGTSTLAKEIKRMEASGRGTTALREEE